jgi:hypothetical protein
MVSNPFFSSSLTVFDKLLIFLLVFSIAQCLPNNVGVRVENDPEKISGVQGKANPVQVETPADSTFTCDGKVHGGNFKPLLET